jgi:hypothetical protein
LELEASSDSGGSQNLDNFEEFSRTHLPGLVENLVAAIIHDKHRLLEDELKSSLPEIVGGLVADLFKAWRESASSILPPPDQDVPASLNENGWSHHMYSCVCDSSFDTFFHSSNDATIPCLPWQEDTSCHLDTTFTSQIEVGIPLTDGSCTKGKAPKSNTASIFPPICTTCYGVL